MSEPKALRRESRGCHREKRSLRQYPLASTQKLSAAMVSAAVLMAAAGTANAFAPSFRTVLPSSGQLPFHSRKQSVRLVSTLESHDAPVPSEKRSTHVRDAIQLEQLASFTDSFAASRDELEKENRDAQLEHPLDPVLIEEIIEPDEIPVIERIEAIRPDEASALEVLPGELEQANRDTAFLRKEAARAISRLEDKYSLSGHTAPSDASKNGLPKPGTEESRVPTIKKLAAYLSASVFIYLSEPLLSLVDTAVVGLTQSTGAVLQLAAMGPATAYMDTLLYMTYFLALATTNQVAEHQARGDYRKLQITTSHLMTLALMMGGVLAGLTFGAGPSVLGQLAGASASPELVRLASGYTFIRAAIAPLSVAGMVGQSFCLVTGNTATVIKAVVLASVSNVIGDLLLTPRFGLFGASAATAVASAASSTLLLTTVFRQMRKWRRKEAEAARDSGDDVAVSDDKSRRTPVPLLSLPDFKSLSKLVTLALPLAFTMWARMGSYAALTFRAGTFGVISLAAHNVLLRIFYFLSAVPDSLGQTAQAFLPETVYPEFRKRDFRKLLRRLGGLAAATALICTQASRLALGSGASLLAKDASIVRQIAACASFMGASLFLHPWITVLEGSVIAQRKFGALVRTYMTTLVTYAGLLKYTCSSLADVWRALVLWQVSRLLNFLFWDRLSRRRTDDAVAAVAP